MTCAVGRTYICKNPVSEKRRQIPQKGVKFFNSANISGHLIFMQLKLFQSLQNFAGMLTMMSFTFPPRKIIIPSQIDFSVTVGGKSEVPQTPYMPTTR